MGELQKEDWTNVGKFCCCYHPGERRGDSDDYFGISTGGKATTDGATIEERPTGIAALMAAVASFTAVFAANWVTATPVAGNSVAASLDKAEAEAEPVSALSDIMLDSCLANCGIWLEDSATVSAPPLVVSDATDALATALTNSATGLAATTAAKLVGEIVPKFGEAASKTWLVLAVETAFAAIALTRLRVVAVVAAGKSTAAAPLAFNAACSPPAAAANASLVTEALVDGARFALPTKDVATCCIMTWIAALVCSSRVSAAVAPAFFICATGSVVRNGAPVGRLSCAMIEVWAAAMAVAESGAALFKVGAGKLLVTCATTSVVNGVTTVAIGGAVRRPTKARPVTVLVPPVAQTICTPVAAKR